MRAHGESMPPVTAREYYWRWLIQFGRQARSNIRELVVGLVIALVILVLQAHYRASEIKDFHADLLATIWPYIGAALLYLLYALVRAPLILDRERAIQNTETNRKLDELTKGPAFQLRGEITQLQVTNWVQAEVSAMSISAVIRVRLLGSDTTASVHHVQLWLVGLDQGSTIAEGPWDFKGRFMGPRRMDFNFQPVPLSEVRRAEARNSQWRFTFRDHNDHEYESEIFQLDKA